MTIGEHRTNDNDDGNRMKCNKYERDGYSVYLRDEANRGTSISKIRFIGSLTNERIPV